MSNSPSEPSMRPGDDSFDLSEHLRWMRALARGLVKDEATADDVVQEAAVAALRESTRPTNVRAWLASVLRNRARDAGRRSAAARRREVEYARPEGDGETQELEERAAIGAELSQRVLELDEPLRSTLLMRYWDDLPPRVIAKRTGVPVATVQSRLARGLARLRQQLDESRDGDRSAWLMAVLPLARKAPLVAAPAAAGWTLMNTKVSATVAAAALLGGALYLLPEGGAAAGAEDPVIGQTRHGRSNGGGSGSSGGGSTDSGPGTRRQVGSRRTPSAAAAAAPAPVYGLGARVVDGDALAVSGVQVEIRMPTGFLARFDESFGSSVRERWEVATDQGGTFAFDAAPLIAGARIVATKEGRAEASMEVPAAGRSDIDLALVGGAAVLRAIEAGAQPGRYERPGDPGAERGGWPEFVEVRLGAPPLTITGVVVDVSEQPMAGARVWLDDPTEFGTLGIFPMRQEALSAGLAPSDEAVRSLASLGEPGAGESHGSATDVGPPSASLQYVLTDGEGRFKIDGLTDRRYVLNVLGPDLDYLGRSEPIAAGAKDARITVETAGRYAELRGRVVTRTGEPVPDVFVTPWVPALSAEIDVRDGTSSITRYFLAKGVRSDESGTFVLENVPRSFVQFYLGGRSILPGYSSVEAVTDPNDFEIEVSARVEVSLEVIDSSLGIDEVTAVDVGGARMQLLRMFADGYSTYESIPVEDGRTGAFALTTDAAALELRSAGALVDTIPVALVPGEMNRIVR